MSQGFIRDYIMPSMKSNGFIVFYMANPNYVLAENVFIEDIKTGI